jgi:HSP20 family protein
MARYTIDPFEELRRMQDRIGRLFEEMPESARSPEAEGWTQMPYVDVIDRGNDIVVTADMPGVDKDDIKISVKDNVLEISARWKTEQEQKEKGYVRHERRYSNYYRSIRLPVAVDKTKAKASFSNGVLEVTLPRTEQARESEIPIS